jgi:hypothetical protein
VGQGSHVYVSLLQQRVNLASCMVERLYSDTVLCMCGVLAHCSQICALYLSIAIQTYRTFTALPSTSTLPSADRPTDMETDSQPTDMETYSQPTHHALNARCRCYIRPLGLLMINYQQKQRHNSMLVPIRLRCAVFGSPVLGAGLVVQMSGKYAPLRQLSPGAASKR